MRLKRYIVMCIAATLIFSSALPSYATGQKPITQDNSENSATVQIKVSDLKEVVVYGEALEAENTTLKQSLESERAAVADMIAEQERERCTATAYAEELESQLTAARAQTARVKRGNNIRNIAIVVLTGAVVGLIASK